MIEQRKRSNLWPKNNMKNILKHDTLKSSQLFICDEKKFC